VSSADDVALRLELLDLRERLREAEETIEAIRHGDVDAVVVGGSGGPAVYTLQSDDRPYRLLIEQIGEGALTLGSDGVVLYCNRALAGLLRVAQESIVGGPLQRFLPAADGVRLERLLERGEGRGEFSLHAGGERRVPVMLSLSELGGGGALCAVVTDLSRQMRASAALHEVNRRLRAEIAERESTEAQLRQAQKMEAVGQLTGGLAHDFNNLLTGIIGSLELIQSRIAQGRTAELARLAEAAMQTANRGAALTHRLLAFSRQQTVEPEATDANRLVAGLEELIRRTAGSSIQVTCLPAAGLWATLCDPSQLENAILNLCINARDAMPGGGRLRIETANARLDEAGWHGAAAGASGTGASGTGDGVPGDYVMVAVADTGTGMSPEVMARVFDPFFTTKPVGQGTGLGLSMIYGFARQSAGHVRIDSAPGQGTTVRLYLPRHLGAAGVVAQKTI
jgi:signal transduction histidine kinase